jgi:hypothetical protein
MTQDLADFVRRALELKIGRNEITRTLTNAGWSEADAAKALAAYADVPFPIPVPRPRPLFSARDAFTYLVLFGALYSSVWAVVSLLFAFIDRMIPDAALANAGYAGAYLEETIRWNIAGLIVSFPIFLYTFRLVTQRIAGDPTARSSPPRRWLTYLTLAMAVSALAGDLITLVYFALSGELTMPFVLKVLVVALVSGGTFQYFLADVRQGEAV